MYFIYELSYVGILCCIKTSRIYGVFEKQWIGHFKQGSVVVLLRTFCLYRALTIDCSNFFIDFVFEPCYEKTCLRGFGPCSTQTGLYNHRRWIEAWNI